ncbi:hypothetical protein LCGC14_2001740 [marine sediment metagenome]|uniref:Flavin reductase like domain-containing protein n=1 Tax=marine sediment metagenome TaxID=412755 RepID=A0A0F9FQP3_9ZZZZ
MQREASYSEVIVNKYPEQIVIAIAKDSRGNHNPITLGWTMIVSGSPPMMAVSIGKTRWSLEAVRSAGEFVIAFPSAGQVDETMLFGTKSGRDTDKLAESGAKTQPAQAIDSVLLSEAVANFECKLAGEMDAGDHVIFAGEVVRSHLSDSPLDRLYTVGPGYKMSGLPRG